MPRQAASVDDIPEYFRPQSLGPRRRITDCIIRAAPFSDVSDPFWIRIGGHGVDIEISLGDEDPASEFAFHVRRGSGTAPGAGIPQPTQRGRNGSFMKPYAVALLSNFFASLSVADGSLSCQVGPIHVELAGAPWQVTSCDDGRSLVFATMKDNPAMPFFFFVWRDATSSRISGEGNGSKEHSAAALAELKKMSATQLDELVQATKAADDGK